MSEPLILAVPSKGRLMEQTAETFARVGMVLRKVGSERGYRGMIEGLEGVEVIFVSASEIVEQLKAGRAHLGVSGEDLAREQVADMERRFQVIRKLGFGHANVVVAVPASWIDVRVMSDLEAVGRDFRRVHGRHMRVATKYMNITRRHFQANGITSYRIVESLGATEGTPAAGTAELIVDITTTGTTLKANGLKVLDDGVLLRSEATLFSSRAARWTPEMRATLAEIARRMANT
ncbi:MAG: ATP phosphoribosyltransferase [Hyphomicrobiaceae bacterium]